MAVLFKKQLQHGRGCTLCDETTPTGCDVEQEEKFLRGNEGRKAPVWWEQPTINKISYAAKTNSKSKS